jgi:hypothetical protein
VRHQRFLKSVLDVVHNCVVLRLVGRTSRLTCRCCWRGR